MQKAHVASEDDPIDDDDEDFLTKIFILDRLWKMSFFTRLFKFRIFKFRTSLSEELEDLHTESTHLQQTLNRTRSLQRQWTRWFAIYAILAYVTLNTVYYALFLPDDYTTQIYAAFISIAVGFLLYAIHWILRWYFRTILQMKEEKVNLFKERKQELIEEVKTKETYAVAKNLLEKYGETMSPEMRSPPTNGHNIPPRVSMRPPVSVVSNSPPPVENLNQTPVRGGTTRLAVGVTPGKLPRTILPAQRTFFGALLDIIVGDGPSKRYALICKSCNSHNGMALEEEFEYLSFRCAYCNYFNGARKQKPVFNPNLVTSPQGIHSERPEMDSSDSSEEMKITRRSIRVPAKASNGNRSDSPSSSTKHQSMYPTLSSSEESLSTDKKQ